MGCHPVHSPTAAAPGRPGIGVIQSYRGTIQEARDYLKVPSKCPRTTSMKGYHANTGRIRFIPLRCKCWSCEHCARINKYNLEQKIASGKPDRMITLTCRPEIGYSPKEIHDRARKKIPILFARLRKEFGQIEYAAVLETTAKGLPHWHILCRGDYIPQAAIKKHWNQLTGNFIVGIEKIRSAKSVQSYIVKYLAKDFEKHKTERLGRLISFSKRYLSPPRVTNCEQGWVWERSDHPTWWHIEYSVHDGYEVEISDAGIITLHPLEPPDLRSAADKWLDQLCGGSMAVIEPAF